MRRRWVNILAFGLLGAMGGSTYALLATPEYSAEAELFVAAVDADSTSDLAQGSNYSQQQARNYAVVATRQVVLDPVVAALGLEITSNQLAHHVSASVPLNTSLISISVTDTSAQRAAATANAVATSLTNVVDRLVPKRSDGSSPVRLETVESASVPTFPSSPNARLAIAFGLFAGMMIGVASIVLRELTGAKIRTPEQIKQIEGLTVLGAVTFDRLTPSQPMVSQTSGVSPRAEEYREIRTNLRFLHAGDSHKVFVITSSIPGEGKSLTAANLAASLAASGSSVCLVEADLRKPALAKSLDLEGNVGLTTVLSNDSTLDDSLQSWGPFGLRVLLSGAIPPNPSELLGSAQARRLFSILRERFQVVIIDCPPLMAVTDAAIVAELCGGAILVVGCGKVEVRELRKATEALAISGSPVLGVIANMAPATTKERYRRVYAQSDEPEAQSTRNPVKPERRLIVQPHAVMDKTSS